MIAKILLKNEKPDFSVCLRPKNPAFAAENQRQNDLLLYKCLRSDEELILRTFASLNYGGVAVGLIRLAQQGIGKILNLALQKVPVASEVIDRGNFILAFAGDQIGLNGIRSGGRGCRNLRRNLAE